MPNVIGTQAGELLNAADGVTSGDDVIDGRGGNDTIYAGGGRDLIWGGEGADDIDGGSGRDTAAYTDSNVGVKVNLQTGKGSGGTAQGDTLVDIENLNGSQYNDVLIGDDKENWVRGEDGNDLVKGYGGSDSLLGNGGHDRLFGMDGNDLLQGDEGNDVLYGGAGNDDLMGGAEADTFAWYFTSEAGLGLTQGDYDEVVDFNFGEGDRIDLASIDADIYAPFNQAFAFIGSDPFTLNTATPENTDVLPGEIRYYHADGDTFIEMQTGNSPNVEGVIMLHGIHTPQASWFML